jgi:Spy/CpxP family protein refolding chaperone
MNIKKMLIAAAVVCSLATPVLAHEKSMDVDEKIAKMKSELNLTEEQANQIRPILEEYKDKMSKAMEEKKDKLRQVLSSVQMDHLNHLNDIKDKDSNPN